MDKSFQLGNMEKRLVFSKTPTPENPPPPRSNHDGQMERVSFFFNQKAYYS